MSDNSIPRLPPPTGGIETPPPSPGKKRRFLRESDDAQGEMLIERYLYISDPYRASSSPNPLPYPLVGVPLPDQAMLDQHKPEILKMLDEHGFKTQPRTNGDIPVKTLRITYFTGVNTLGEFSSARTTIRRYLIAQGFNDVQVDIFHRDLCFQPFCFAISPTDPAVKVYEKVNVELLKLLKESLSSAWRLLSLFKVGQTEDKALPSIVVMVQPMILHDWTGLLAKMQDVISRVCPDRDRINIEFLPGTLAGVPEPESAGGAHLGVSQLDYISDECQVGMGFSVGISGEVGGTAGGFVSFKQNGVTKKCIFTNHHVLIPLESAPSKMVRKANAFGFSPPKDGDEVVELQYLPERQIMSKGQPLTSAASNITVYKAALATRDRQRCFLDSMPLSLGKVLYSSGKLVYKNKIHDWALVELSDAAAAAQFRPNLASPIPPNEKPFKFGPEFSFETKTPAQPPLSSFGRLCRGQYYSKQGRSTHVTGGICNGVLAHCNWSERDRMRFDEFGTQITVEAGSTEEFVIFTKQSCSESYKQGDFCKPGDSGSFLVGDKGTSVCGLLYGCVTGFYGPDNDGTLYNHAGLAMCFSDIAESIKLRTTPMNSSGEPVGPPATLELPNRPEQIDN
ncbi:hypothetical protein AJ79_05368 [Helicocarpus griseus UAMH5409]|uniref:Uncharacterized protein n=1 Tax=Helicocarpus griseus UAMH5409 TaxID=1447875 RepID=A0A2B7XG13_9EURO|nr:hypothetical protein AJ79_05368 [Helicocarpus griseus UAMH5409]